MIRFLFLTSSCFVFYRVFPVCPWCPWWLLSAPNIHDVAFPVVIIPRRKVFLEMGAAALLAPERGARDEARRRDEIQAAPRVGVGRRLTHPVALGALRGVQRGDGVFQAFAPSKETHGRPHQIADIDWGLVARGRRRGPGAFRPEPPDHTP